MSNTFFCFFLFFLVDFKFYSCKVLHTSLLLIIYCTAVTGKLVAATIHSNLNLE